MNFYNSNTIHIQEDSVLRGYRCPPTGLWRIPLQPVVHNENADTLLLDEPGGTTSSNSRYKIQHSRKTLAHLQSSNTPETIAYVYKLPSIAEAVRYLHGAAGFPTKLTRACRNSQWKLQHLVPHQHQECQQTFS